MALPGRALDPKFPHITRNNIGVVVRRMAEADRIALVAAAQVYRRAMTEALKGGYTSGAFYSGLQGVAGSVAVSEPDRDAKGGFIYVGTNIEYAKFWEFGHNNYFTKRYERVEKWRPTLSATGPAIAERYRAVYAAKLAQSAGGAA